MDKDGWRPIETAPCNGEVFIAYWQDVPQFVAWVEQPTREIVRKFGPFWNRKTETERIIESGFRVLIYNPRHGGWSVNAGIAAYTPSCWRELPPPPQGPRA